jgi:hypothetical protein
MLQPSTSYPISSDVSERLCEKSPRVVRTIAFIGCVARMTSSKRSYTKEGWKDSTKSDKNQTDSELRMAERMAVTDKVQALIFYVAARLPDNLAEEFLEIGATGDEFAVLQFVGNKDTSAVLEERIAHCYSWSNLRADESFADFVRANDDSRIWNFGLLENLWNRYNLASSLDKLDSQAAPMAEDLGQMSDEEIEKTLTEARKVRAGNQSC